MLKWFLLVVLLSASRAETNPRHCDLAGYWYNQHGSELFLGQSSHGELKGDFRTAVEAECGSAGSQHARVHGKIDGSLFHLFTFFGDGASTLVSYSGQYFSKCTHAGVISNDGEMLHVSWMMTSLAKNCTGAWSQNRFGQDIFTRTVPSTGARRANGVNTPPRNNCPATRQPRAMPK